jgi:hypothetical protein
MKKPLKLEELSDDEIYQIIGEELLKEEENFSIMTPQQMIEKSKVWFNINLPFFQEKICTNNKLRLLYDKQGDLVLSTAIIDLIIGALGGIAPASVAYLLFRRGLHNVCKNYWDIKG